MENVNVSTVEDLKTLSWKLESLVVGVGCCNGFNNSVSFERFSLLKSLVIGDNCFTKATMLLVQDMECLERVAIGDYSFTEYEGVFYAVACPCLTELTIGASSFVHYQQCVIESTRRGGCEE